MTIDNKWLGLQMFADGGTGASGDGGGDGAGTAESGVQSPVAEETRLRELGVPESVLAKRAKRAKGKATVEVSAPTTQKAATKVENPEDGAQQVAAAEEKAPEEGKEAKEAAAPSRMTWEEIMADPEYNKQMQSTVQARIKSSKEAVDTLNKLNPAIELLAKRYNVDAKDMDALTSAIVDDNAYYEQKAIDMGVPVETAKMIQQTEQEAARMRAEMEKSEEDRKIQEHLQTLRTQADALKERFPNINLEQELQNPAFFRMTSPSVGLSVEDAYYAVHRNEIQAASMKAAAENTAKQMANAIRSGQSRPIESGTSAQAPSVTTFDYSKATKEQREAIKREIRAAAAQGRKISPSDIHF